jgi:hypothetical protein
MMTFSTARTYNQASALFPPPALWPKLVPAVDNVIVCTLCPLRDRDHAPMDDGAFTEAELEARMNAIRERHTKV